MALIDPSLDNRKFDDIVAELRLRIPRFSPEYTNFNESDPGMTLVDLFAWLAKDEVIYYETSVSYHERPVVEDFPKEVTVKLGGMKQKGKDQWERATPFPDGRFTVEPPSLEKGEPLHINSMGRPALERILRAGLALHITEEKKNGPFTGRDNLVARMEKRYKQIGKSFETEFLPDLEKAQNEKKLKFE